MIWAENRFTDSFTQHLRCHAYFHRCLIVISKLRGCQYPKIATFSQPEIHIVSDGKAKKLFCFGVVVAREIPTCIVSKPESPGRIVAIGRKLLSQVVAIHPGQFADGREIHFIAEHEIQRGISDSRLGCHCLSNRVF
jgi:hypothetical protein